MVLVAEVAADGSRCIFRATILSEPSEPGAALGARIPAAREPCTRAPRTNNWDEWWSTMEGGSEPTQYCKRKARSILWSDPVRLSSPQVQPPLAAYRSLPMHH